MPGEAIKIGPFTGGLNTFSDAASVEDNQLVECLNFEPDFDGSLKSRPPATAVGVNMPLGSTGNARILGTYYGALSKPYLIASDGLTSTYRYDVGINSQGVWTLITSTFAATAMAQFDNKAWLLAPVGSTNPGGSWTLAGGFVADANMPKGEILLSHKLRLWIALGKDSVANGTRLYFSKLLGVAPFWLVSPDFVDIGGGDGQSIVNAISYYQSIVLFRTSSIYNFSYSSDPAAGVVSNMIPGIGLQNRDCLAMFENYVYFMYQGKAYELVNARASQINIKVPFVDTTRVDFYAPQSVSIFNGRVLFQWWNYTYAFYLNTRIWTRWETSAHLAFGAWYETLNSSVPEAVCFSSKSVTAGISGPRTAEFLSIRDEFSDKSEVFKCAAETKSYSYEAATVFKRMYWWAVIAAFNGAVLGTVTSVGFQPQATWGQIRRGTWGDLLRTTWGSLSSDNYVNVAERITAGSGSQRKTVKMATRAFRFRQVIFRVEFDTDGTKNTSPVRFNSLMTYVRAKQTVSKTVS